MKRFIIDCDTQVDFCAKGGRFYITDADKILDNCELLINEAVKKKELIIGSIDTHSYDSWEFKNNTNIGPNGEKLNFPVHCVKGTNGWLKMNDTMVKRNLFIPDYKIDHLNLNKILQSKQNLQAIYFEKEVYSMFANSNTENVLFYLLENELQKNCLDAFVEYVIFGVATDCSVIATVLELKKYCNNVKINHSIKLVTDAIAGIDKNATIEALKEMKNSGIEFITTNEIIGLK